jgi:hypothetical protein
VKRIGEVTKHFSKSTRGRDILERLRIEALQNAPVEAPNAVCRSRNSIGMAQLQLRSNAAN